MYTKDQGDVMLLFASYCDAVFVRLTARDGIMQELTGARIRMSWKGNGVTGV